MLTGEIIFQRASYCDYSVVQTEQGFAFLDMGARVTDGRVSREAGTRWVVVDARP
jgi:hypothetical protein